MKFRHIQPLIFYCLNNLFHKRKKRKALFKELFSRHTELLDYRIIILRIIWDTWFKELPLINSIETKTWEDQDSNIERKVLILNIHNIDHWDAILMGLISF